MNGETKNEPITIMGKSLDEIVVILSALELERIEDMKMTMSNLNKWIERVREEYTKDMQRALDKTFGSLKGIKRDEFARGVCK